MPATQEQIDIAARHQVLLERLKAEEVRQAEDDGSLIEEAALALILTSGFSNARDLKKKEALELARAIAIRTGELNGEFIDAFTGRLNEIAEYETRFERRALRKVLGGGVDLKPAANAWGYALNRPMGHSGETVAKFLSEWKSSEVESLRNAIQKAYVDGLTLQEIVDGIRGTKNAAFADGLTQKLKNWRKTNVNTLIQHISMAAKEAVWLANSDLIERYQWISILDSRTTDICRGRSRKIYEVGNGPIPPAHRNCRSFIVPLIDE